MLCYTCTILVLYLCCLYYSCTTCATSTTWYDPMSRKFIVATPPSINQKRKTSSFGGGILSCLRNIKPSTLDPRTEVLFSQALELACDVGQVDEGLAFVKDVLALLLQGLYGDDVKKWKLLFRVWVPISSSFIYLYIIMLPIFTPSLPFRHQ